jgi:diadenosine tetraphosphate (Ap4A) HIT family hydrolase
MTASKCVFCQLPRERIVDENEHAVLILDGFPVSPGHSLIVPKRHVGSFFELSAPERQALLGLLDIAHSRLRDSHKPDGFNVGINDGAAAGQTVSHLHIHLIPRYAGDQPDPRGGVRWVIPEKADYWSGRQP